MPASALSRLEASLSDAAGVPIELERPADPGHGDYATNVALRSAPSQGRAPRELAAEIAEAVTALPEVDRAEVAGPGFVNLFLADSWFAGALAEILDAGDAFGAGSPQPPLRVQVEMVSANPTGPITVAAARNGAYGDSVARLLELAGHEVEREYYYNDAGRQMELFRESVEAIRRGEAPPENGYQGEYVVELPRRGGTVRRYVISSKGKAQLAKLRGEMDEEVRRQLKLLAYCCESASNPAMAEGLRRLSEAR